MAVEPCWYDGSANRYPDDRCKLCGRLPDERVIGDEGVEPARPLTRRDYLDNLAIAREGYRVAYLKLKDAIDELEQMHEALREYDASHDQASSRDTQSEGVSGRTPAGD